MTGKPGPVYERCRLSRSGLGDFLRAISVIAGIVVLAYPFDSIVTLALVTGIWLIIVGVMEIVSGFGMRSDLKKIERI